MRSKQAKSKYQKWGWQQEKLAAKEATHRGLEVIVPQQWQASFDMTLVNKRGQVIQVEVKAARARARELGNGYKGVRLSFNNMRGDGTAHVYWLRAWWEGEVTDFFVPAKVMAEKTSTVCITSDPKKYKGWLAEYRDRWDILLERMV